MFEQAGHQEGNDHGEAKFWDLLHYDPASDPTRISMRLALESSVPSSERGDYESLSGENILDLAASLKTLHLEWRNIKEITGLEPFDRCETLYLQYNRIQRIENLECLENLTFLALQKNQIERVENLRHLRKLEFLDLSQNRITAVDAEEIPKPRLFILNLRGNPVSDAGGYSAEDLMSHLPNLVTLDGVDLYPEEEDEDQAQEQPKKEAEQQGAVSPAVLASSVGYPRPGSGRAGGSAAGAGRGGGALGEAVQAADFGGLMGSSDAMGEDPSQGVDQLRNVQAERAAMQRDLAEGVSRQIGDYSQEAGNDQDALGDTRARIRQRTQLRQERQKERDMERQKELEAELEKLAQAQAAIVERAKATASPPLAPVEEAVGEESRLEELNDPSSRACADEADVGRADGTELGE